jgi:hypothetical protein
MQNDTSPSPIRLHPKAAHEVDPDLRRRTLFGLVRPSLAMGEIQPPSPDEILDTRDESLVLSYLSLISSAGSRTPRPLPQAISQVCDRAAEWAREDGEVWTPVLDMATSISNWSGWQDYANSIEEELGLADDAFRASALTCQSRSWLRKCAETAPGWTPEQILDLCREGFSSDLARNPHLSSDQMRVAFDMMISRPSNGEEKVASLHDFLLAMNERIPHAKDHPWDLYRRANEHLDDYDPDKAGYRLRSELNVCRAAAVGGMLDSPDLTDAELDQLIDRSVREEVHAAVWDLVQHRRMTPDRFRKLLGVWLTPARQLDMAEHLKRAELLHIMDEFVGEPSGDVMCALAGHPYASPELRRKYLPRASGELLYAWARQTHALADPDIYAAVSKSRAEAICAAFFPHARIQHRNRAIKPVAQRNPELAVQLIEWHGADGIAHDTLGILLSSGDEDLRLRTIAAIGKRRAGVAGEGAKKKDATARKVSSR